MAITYVLGFVASHWLLFLNLVDALDFGDAFIGTRPNTAQFLWHTLVLAILEGKILIPNDQGDILHVSDKTSVKINPSDGQPGQPLEKTLLSGYNGIR
jgi:hypothetical protein